MIKFRSPVIIIAPNEDGFGPSSFAYHIVNRLFETQKDCTIILRTGTKENFNRELYSKNLIADDKPTPGKIFIDHHHNLISIKRKESGSIDPLAAINALSDYADLREEYMNLPLYGAHAAIDIGVPALAAAAKNHSIPCFKIFDHAWSLTFEKIFKNIPEKERLRYSGDSNKKILNTIDLIRRDESNSNRVFLFPPPVTPAEYKRYWIKLCGNDRVSIFNGVLGGPRNKNEQHKFRKRSRALLGLSDSFNRPVVLISAGGTPVWETMLIDLLKAYILKHQIRELHYNIFIFVAKNVREQIVKEGIALEQKKSFPVEDKEIELFPVKNCKRVSLLGKTFSCGYQDIIAGTDLVVSRAGGATVNDSLACGVPMLLIEETGHFQVEAIRKSAVEKGLAWSLSFKKFATAPVQSIEEHIALLKNNVEQIKKRIISFPRNSEIPIVKQISDDLKVRRCKMDKWICVKIVILGDLGTVETIIKSKSKNWKSHNDGGKVENDYDLITFTDCLMFFANLKNEDDDTIKIVEKLLQEKGYEIGEYPNPQLLRMIAS